MSLLKPCKKCGENIDIGYICDNFNLDEDYYVYCYTCGNKTNVYKFKQQAIDAWNRREK